MTKDPYSILGIQPTASDDEVKKAYRELAKKYHPDRYADTPMAELAQEKMQEINEAYDTIMNRRRSGNNTTGGYGNRSSNFPDIRSLILQNRLEEAQELLDGVTPEHRDAEWYFLNGSVQYRRGWFDNAFTSYSTACRMDPSNTEYREALNRMNHYAGGFGANHYRSSGNMGGCSTCDICQGLICADCCCECMGGDLIRCC